MKHDALIIGGGVGGCAAAMAVCEMGGTAVLVAEHDWIGGQFTAQAVPPDEHPWIESFGCTARYRRFRNLVRQRYRESGLLSSGEAAMNPGACWVSRLCFEPRVGVETLYGMLSGHLESGQLKLLAAHRLDRIEIAQNGARTALETGDERIEVEAHFVLDATEEGDVLAAANIPYRLGAESCHITGEPHALDGESEPENVQSFTWVAAIRSGPMVKMEQPAQYDHWRAHAPDWWGGPILSWDGYGADPDKPMRFGLYDDCALFTYRRVIAQESFDAPVDEVSLLNWPQNDYTPGSIIDVSRETREALLEAARQQTLSVIYWLRTEAGHPEISLCPETVGTHTGLAREPYIREARRLNAVRMLSELDVGADCNPGSDRTAQVPDSVGIGAYRIDLHASANGRKGIDLASLPFQIPLSCLIPKGGGRLIAAGKCLGVTHIANGCTRLHPVEWNVGEAAGALAVYCARSGCEPIELTDNPGPFQDVLRAQGIELEWPTGTELHPL